MSSSLTRFAVEKIPRSSAIQMVTADNATLSHVLTSFDFFEGGAVPSEHKACDSRATLSVFTRRSACLLLCNLEEVLDGERVHLDVSHERLQEAVSTIAAEPADMLL